MHRARYCIGKSGKRVKMVKKKGKQKGKKCPKGAKLHYAKRRR